MSFLQESGGTLTGNLTINKSDTALATFDFSGAAHHARKIFKTEAYSTTTTDSYTTFGVTNNYWEYAWEFNNNEDFCWTHGTTGKQFSITKEGATAKNLFIADFITNSVDGRHVVNEIDVKGKLNSLDAEMNTAQQDIHDIQTHIAANPLNQIFYDGTAPNGANLNNGDIWFDNVNLRLNIRHSNAWIHPDRVEDSALKSALFNAVSTATDFDTLKLKLMAALV